jgi:IS5 family transposase
MKLHIGADKRGIVHTVTATDARVADITELPHLLHGREREVFGDQAYWKEADRQAFAARGVRYRINRRHNRRPLSERWRLINRARSRTRTCGEHPFRVVKQLWGFTKVRYRGLAKNLARAQTVFALTNLYQLRRELLAMGAEWRSDLDRQNPELLASGRGEQQAISPLVFRLIRFASTSNNRCTTSCAELS